MIYMTESKDTTTGWRDKKDCGEGSRRENSRFHRDKGMLKFGHRVCVYHKMQGSRKKLWQKLITLSIRYILEQQRCIMIFEQISDGKKWRRTELTLW